MPEGWQVADGLGVDAARSRDLETWAQRTIQATVERQPWRLSVAPVCAEATRLVALCEGARRSPARGTEECLSTQPGQLSGSRHPCFSRVAIFFLARGRFERVDRVDGVGRR